MRRCWSWRPDHETAQYAWDYRWCRVIDCGALPLQWSQKNVPLSLDSAEATEASVVGLSRRVHRRAYRRAIYGTAVAAPDYRAYAPRCCLFFDPFAPPRFRFNVGADRYRPEYISPPAG